jgi:hypothetical protein
MNPEKEKRIARIVGICIEEHGYIERIEERLKQEDLPMPSLPTLDKYTGQKLSKLRKDYEIDLTRRLCAEHIGDLSLIRAGLKREVGHQLSEKTIRAYCAGMGLNLTKSESTEYSKRPGELSCEDILIEERKGLKKRGSVYSPDNL